jgi:membrane protease YdiL (CAAX protease family)
VSSSWQRLPVIVRALIAGLAVALAGITPWGGIAGFTGLAGWNLRVLVGVPWAIAPMALYLWLFFKYLNGAGWPRSTAQARRTSLRANPLSGDVWAMSLFAGFIGLASLVPLTAIMGRLYTLPAEAQPIDVPAGMPFITTFVLLVMSSLVAGIAEESGFRGYMQGPIERKYGLIAALLISGTMFGLGHFNHHPVAVLQMLPFYLAVSAIYGGLAYATNSILPGVVMHAGGDIWSLTRLWTTGKPDWQLSPAPSGLIWETGIDPAFVTSVAAFIILAGVATWAYIGVARAARSEEEESSRQEQYEHL